MVNPILIVDDNDVDRFGMMELIRGAGYTVAGVRDGRAALSFLAKQACALIILDMLMTGIDGWEFLEIRGRSLELKTTPVLVVTGLPVATENWAQGLGADALIKKPIDTEDLLKRLMLLTTKV